LTSTARAYFRDFDGITRQVPAYGRTKTEAESNLVDRLKERIRARRGGMLTSMDRFSVGADLWYSELEQKVRDGTRSPDTLDGELRQQSHRDELDGADGEAAGREGQQS
jgi:hypothetical protein